MFIGKKNHHHRISLFDTKIGYFYRHITAKPINFYLICHFQATLLKLKIEILRK